MSILLSIVKSAFNHQYSMMLLTMMGALLAKTVSGQSNGLDPTLSLTQYYTKTWNKQDGLPTSGANSLTQLENGYLCLATDNGLAHFDGLAIGKMILDSAFVQDQNAFSIIYQDPIFPYIWTALSNQWIARFEQQEKTLTVLSEGQGLPPSRVTTLIRTHDETFWIGTTKGLHVLENNTIQPFPHPFLAEASIADVQETADGLWVTTRRQGVFLIRHRHVVKHIEPEVSPHPLTSFTQSWLQTYWLGTENGLFPFSFSGDRPTPGKQLLPNQSVTVLFTDTQGTLWAGTDKGLYRIHQQRAERFELPLHTWEYTVTDIMEDSHKNLWVTTARSGFFVLHQGETISYSKQEGLLDDKVYAAHPLVNGEVLVGTARGMNAIVNKTGAVKTWETFKPKTAIRAISSDARGNHWIGTSEGLFKLTDGGQGNKVSLDEGNTLEVRDILAHPDSTLWIGTSQGLYQMLPHGETRLVPLGLNSDKTGIKSLFLDSNKRLWITTEKGLYTFESENPSMHFEKIEGLGCPVIHRVFEDEEGRYWIGSDCGLFVYHRGQAKVIRATDGLPSNAAYQVLPGKANTVWVTSNQGIYQLRTDKAIARLNAETPQQQPPFRIRLFDKTSGMKTEECTENGKAIIDAHGNFWIPTYRGVVKFSPQLLQDSNPAPEVIIEEVLHDGRPINPENGIYTIPAQANRIDIHYSGIDFITPDRVQFRYGLSDFDNKLQVAYGTHTASYTNLPDGQYTFRILASDGNGNWGGRDTSIHLVKLPKIYEQTLFKIAIGFVVALAISGFTWWRNRRVAIQKHQLELEVKKRTNSLKEKSLEIEHQKEELEDINTKLVSLNEEKNHLISVVAHDLKSPLNQIKGLLNIVGFNHSNLDEEQKKYIELSLGATDRLSNLITKILDVNAIESKKVDVHPSAVPLDKFVSDTLENYQEQAEKKYIDLQFHALGSDPHIFVDKHILLQIFDNLVSNALKFSPKGKRIDIFVAAHEGNYRFAVTDQGPGISEEDKRKLFGKYQKLTAQPTDGESSTGLGLSIVKLYTEHMGGKVWCESQPGEGASFIVEFPAMKEANIKQS